MHIRPCGILCHPSESRRAKCHWRITDISQEVCFPSFSSLSLQNCLDVFNSGSPELCAFNRHVSSLKSWKIMYAVRELCEAPLHMSSTTKRPTTYSYEMKMGFVSTPVPRASEESVRREDTFCGRLVRGVSGRKGLLCSIVNSQVINPSATAFYQMASKTPRILNCWSLWTVGS